MRIMLSAFTAFRVDTCNAAIVTDFTISCAKRGSPVMEQTAEQEKVTFKYGGSSLGEGCSHCNAGEHWDVVIV